MTKRQLLKRVRAVIADDAAWMLRFAEATIDSGAYDLALAPDDYGLPKDILCAAHMRLSSTFQGHGPVCSAGKRRVARIRANTPSVR